MKILNPSLVFTQATGLSKYQQYIGNCTISCLWRSYFTDPWVVSFLYFSHKYISCKFIPLPIQCVSRNYLYVCIRTTLSFWKIYNRITITKLICCKDKPSNIFRLSKYETYPTVVFLHTPGFYIKIVFLCPLGYFEMFHLHMLHTSHNFKEFQIQRHLQVHSKTSGGSTENY